MAKHRSTIGDEDFFLCDLTTTDENSPDFDLPEGANDLEEEGAVDCCSYCFKVLCFVGLVDTWRLVYDLLLCPEDLSLSALAVVVDSNKTPTATQQNPNHHRAGCVSPKNRYPKRALVAKFEAVESAVPATLPEA